MSESLPGYRDRDLDFMGEYVRDNFFSFDHVSEKRFQCLLATPKEAYKAKDYTAVRKFEKDPWNFDNLFPDDPEMPELNALNKLLKSYFDLPIAALALPIDTSSLDEGIRSGCVVFYCERLGHGNFVMFRETELLVNKLVKLFGNDMEDKGSYIFTENVHSEEQHVFRRWQLGNLEVSLVDSQPTWGNFLCLCFDFVNSKKVTN